MTTRLIARGSRKLPFFGQRIQEHCGAIMTPVKTKREPLPLIDLIELPLTLRTGVRQSVGKRAFLLS